MIREKINVLKFKFSVFKIKHKHMKLVKHHLKVLKFCIHQLDKICIPTSDAKNETMKKLLSVYDETIVDLNKSVDIYRDKVDKFIDKKLIVYRVGFNGNDETEVDATCENEAIELARTVATESGLEFKLDYVETCGYVKD